MDPCKTNPSVDPTSLQTAEGEISQNKAKSGLQN